MNKNALLVLAIIIAAGVTFYQSRSQTTTQPMPIATQQSILPMSSQSAVLGVRTKLSDCVARGPLPDNLCTPGGIFTTATKEMICVSGYSKKVRNVPSRTKAAVYKQYGVTTRIAGQYEVDHLVSLELGGSNDIANLWPEPADPTPGFHEKDVVENQLHDQVCTGQISLADAQKQIAENWVALYPQR